MRILIVVFILFFNLYLFAQPKISFENISIELKSVSDEDYVKSIFRFKNIGNKDLIVAHVLCNDFIKCSWPKEPIKPHQTGEICVTFNNVEEYYFFHEFIKVISNSVINNPQKLKFHGHFSDSIGPVLKIINNTIDLGSIYDGDTVSATFKYINTGNRPLIITEASGYGYKRIRAKLESRPVQPNDSGEIQIFYVPSGCCRMEFKEYINIECNSIKHRTNAGALLKGNVKTHKTTISFDPVINQNNDCQVREHKNIDTLYCDFGKMNLGQIKTAVFKFVNDGDYPLRIYCNQLITENTFSVNISEKDNFDMESIEDCFVKKGNTYHFNCNLYKYNDAYYNDCKPNESGYFKILAINDVGNIGKYSMIVDIRGNVDKKYVLIIKAEFIDKSKTSELIYQSTNHSTKKYFKKGRVVRIKYWRFNKKYQEEMFEY